MSALSTRDALAQAIRVVDGNHDLGAGALADALIDSGAVIDADTLADDEALTESYGERIRQMFSNGEDYPAEVWTDDARGHLRTLATILSERAS